VHFFIPLKHLLKAQKALNIKAGVNAGARQQDIEKKVKNLLKRQHFYDNFAVRRYSKYTAVTSFPHVISEWKSIQLLLCNAPDYYGYQRVL